MDVDYLVGDVEADISRFYSAESRVDFSRTFSRFLDV